MAEQGEHMPGFRPDVQGLRALAVLAVVVFHAGLPLSGGFVGVDVFFVVSGFVITRLLRNELGSSGRVSMANFYSRRARRLLPAFVVFSLVTLVASVLLLSPLGSQPQQHALGTGAAASLFSANWFLYLRGGGYWGAAETLNPFLHTWSLSVEEQFYLVIPALFSVLWGWSRRRGHASPARLLAGVVLAMSGVSLVLSWALSTARLSLGSPVRLAFYSTPTRVWEFGAGALLALAGTRAERLPRPLRDALAVSGLAALVFSLVAFDESTVFPGLAALIPVAATAALILAGGGDGPARTVLSWRPLTWIGDRSYGWYLWHWPFIVFAGVLWPGSDAAKALAAALSIVPTVVSFRWIEQRIRLDRRIVGLRAVRLAVPCLLVPVLLAGAGYAGARSGWGLDAPAEWARQGIGFREQCHSRDQDRSPWPEQRCRFDVPDADAKGLILLLGDSHGAAISSGVVAAGHDAGYDVAVWTRSGCPFVLPEAAPDRPLCPGWEDRALDLVDELHPDLVVVVNRSPGYTLAIEAVDDLGNRTGGEFASSEQRADALTEWRGRFDGMLDELDGRETHALVVSDVPDWGLGFPDGSVSILRPEPNAPVVSRSRLEARRQPVVDVEADLIEQHPTAGRFDPFPYLCATDDCTPVIDGTWTYFDNNHLTEAGSLRLVEPLRAAMVATLAR